MLESPCLKNSTSQRERDRIPHTVIGSVSTFLCSQFVQKLLSLICNIKFDLIIGHHECWDVIQITQEVAESLRSRSAIVLQLPPFYSNSKKGLENYMFDSLDLRFLAEYSSISGYYQFLSSSFRERVTNVLNGKLIRLLGETPLTFYYKIKNSKRLSRIDKVLAVSSSIPYEMGEKWMGKIRILRPGIGVDEISTEFHNGTINKKEYVFHFARLAPTKGILEIPLIWRKLQEISKEKKVLYIAGQFNDHRVEEAFATLVNKLNLTNSIHYLGYVDRKTLSRAIAEAKAILYPSHLDSSSLVVLESLALGTPVVAYDIPAIKYNYSDNAGVHMVPEYNMNAMALELNKVLQTESRNQRETLPTWDEVTRTEIEMAF